MATSRTGTFTLGESPAPIHLDALDRAIDLTTTMAKLARAVQKDRTAWGNYDHLNEEEAETNSLDGKQQTAWLVVSQYQGFTDPGTSNVIYCTGGQTAATTKGLAMYATEQF